MIGDFKITYEFNRLPRQLQTPIESQYNFEELRDGFWLDAQHKLVREDRGVYWIPSSRIMIIERLQ